MLLKSLNTNIDKICRLCLSLCKDFNNEFMSISKIPDVINKIKDCVALEIELNEKFPSVICVPCLQQINQWATFRDVCHQSQTILIQSVESLDEQNNEDDDDGSNDKIKEENEIPDKDDYPEELNDNEDSESSDTMDDDPYDETFEPDVEIETKPIVTGPSGKKRGRPRKKPIVTTKIKRRKYTLKKKNVKTKKTAITHKREVEEISTESEDDDDDIIMEDTIEALEKYLHRLNQEETENEIRRDVLQIYSYECEICRSIFNSMFDYLDHQETHNGQPVFGCYRCDQVFTCRADLVDHDSRHQVPCPKCGKMILPGCLKTHMVLHTDKYKCIQCNWRFCNSTMLRQHVESVHIRLKTHVCETCGKSFTSTTSLQTHIKIHSDARPYNCKVCDYSGRTASALYTHMARHENGLHVCEICAKSFKSFRSLRDHTRRVHSEKKNHECGFCQKKFVDKYMLTVHTRTHTGARPYQCTLCDRAFVRSDGLREHLATHGQRASYSCQQCGKKFIYRRSLGRHTCTALIH